MQAEHLTNHSIYLNRSAACRETHLQEYMWMTISHAAISCVFTISNINININFTMGFCKLYLGSREIERHIYYIKRKLLGLLSLT